MEFELTTQELQIQELSAECKSLVRQTAGRPGFAKLLIGINTYLIDAIASHPMALQKLRTIHAGLKTFASYKGNRSARFRRR